MKFVTIILSSTSALAAFSVAAHAGSATTPAFNEATVASTAQPSSFGYIGVTGTVGHAINPTDNDVDTAIAPSIEGAYGFMLNNGSAVVIDALVRIDTYHSDIVGNEDSELQYQASAHYLHPMSNQLTLGGFAGYGMAPFEDDNEKYQVGFIGASVVYDISDKTSIFGQATYGTSFDADEMSSAGFYNGYVIRTGVDFKTLDSTTLRAEIEFASTEEYEDSSEPGEMWTVGVSGETPYSSIENLSITYGARYAYFDALNDDDNISEMTVSVGVKYAFGGGTSEKFNEIGYIGSPHLPLRGSFWTPAMD